MDPNLNDVYQEDAVACSNATLLENGNMTATEQLEPDILLSIKKEDLVCPYNLHISFCTLLQRGTLLVAQLGEALCYKPEGRGFDS
jgi:hypothetical protein